MEQSARKKVVSAATVNSFKARLDRFWTNEEIYYNYKANISCIGSRSNYDVDLEWLLLLQYVCKYCIVTMDWTSRISYVHTGQYYYYYNNRPTTNRIGLQKKSSQ